MEHHSYWVNTHCGLKPVTDCNNVTTRLEHINIRDFAIYNKKREGGKIRCHPLTGP